MARMYRRRRPGNIEGCGLEVQEKVERRYRMRVNGGTGEGCQDVHKEVTMR